MVIAIISLLAAILFPVFARARENARRTSCQSNLKQIGLGLMQYTQDFDEKLPLVYFGPAGPGGSNPGTGSYKWMDAIYPYVKSEQLFVCPSASNNGAGNSLTRYVYTFRSNWTLGTDPYAYGSYMGNAAYYNQAQASTATGKHGPFQWPPSWSQIPNPVALAKIGSVSTTVFCSDGGTLKNGTQAPWQGTFAFAPYDSTNVITKTAPDGTDCLWDTANPTVPGYINARHLGTANSLFCDGHVKAYRVDSLNEKSTVAGSTDYARLLTINDD